MTNNSLMKVSLKWGLIYAGISCLIVVASYAFGLGTNNIAGIIVGVLSFIINILILVLANKDYRNTYLNGYIGYWQCFLNSLLVIVISTVIVSLVTFLLYQVIDPQAFENMINEQLLTISQNEAIPAQYKEAQIDALVAMTPLKQSLFQLLGGLIWGLILSFIISAFTRKKNNTFEGAIKEIE